MSKDEKFSVFISWSQKPAEQIASSVMELLKKIFAINNDFNFFLSVSESGGIDKGENFRRKLDDNLFKSNFGILILTKNNINRPWILFEAGSLAKNTDIARVCPILFDTEIEKESPLSAFQSTKCTKEDFVALCQSILKAHNGVEELNQEQKNTIEKHLELEWSKFEADVKDKLNDPQYKMACLGDSLYNKGLSSDGTPYLKREEQLKKLIQQLNDNKQSRMIVFGGISTVIRDATKELANWIINNENSKLFICYENKELINDRKAILRDDVYAGLNKTDELLDRKKNKLEEFKNYFECILGVKPRERIHFLELSERLSGYVTINGTELFFTPLLHERSSLTFTFKLNGQQLLDVVSYMMSRINHDVLLGELKAISEEVS